MLSPAVGAGKKKGGSSGGVVVGNVRAFDPTRFQLTRIGVGIGRPASREPEEVAEYVLGRMPDRQMEVTAGLVEELVRILEKEAEMMDGMTAVQIAKLNISPKIGRQKYCRKDTSDGR
ncbi:peptidyl-tRNA hydrolase [Histoplasma capsulatum]|uniref:Peptidyl-tRNA hydrolase n=1 Tax=Ajellomyces capsulatus TaxID=5037 RepID=A0A8A1MPF0_AJECA|nr:peptidyl-tRNA hydrolase [Histoplasma capsulatum]